MEVAPLLLDLYGRIPPLAAEAVAGLPAARLTEPPGPGINPIAWLIWHLARVQDHHVSELMDEPQLWVTGDWAAGVGLTPDPDNTGYGHSVEEVGSVRPTGPDALLGYLLATDGRSRTFIRAQTAADLDRVVDRRWDPPVTMGVRLVSVADDCLQHVGQAAYAKGMLLANG
jgi:hypothetical protein